MTDFALGEEGKEFSVKLIDCESTLPFDVNDVDDSTVFIRFYKPRNVIIVKPGILIPDPENVEEFIIQYINGNDGTPPETESILDTRGYWQFSGGGDLINGDSFETSQRASFQVT